MEVNRSKQYHLLILCYFRVSVNEVVLRGSIENGTKIYENATLGDVAKKTKVLNNVNPKWDELILFVVVEPFDGSLVLTVKVQPNTNGGEKCNYWKVHNSHGKCTEAGG